MKKLLLILLCLPFISFGQSFIKEYNQSGWGRSVIQTSDNGYIFASNINIVSNDSLEYALYKTDEYGNVQWDRISGGIFGNVSAGGESVFQLADGKFISLSLESPNLQSPLSKIRLIKRDQNGNGLWEKNYQADSCAILPMSLVATNDGGYIIYANVNCDLIGGEGYNYLIKTDNMGIIIWEKLYDEQQLFFPFLGGGSGTIPMGGFFPDIEQTIDGGFIISGTGRVAGGIGEPAIAKLNTQGDIDWIKSYANISNLGAFGFSVEQTNDAGYILSGSAAYGSSPSSPESNGFIIKTDNSGNLMWSIIDSMAIGVHDVKQTTDGGYIYISNYGTDFPTYNFSTYIALNKIDPSGNNLWNKSFTNLNYWAMSNIEQTNDGGYVLCGTSIDTTIGIFNLLLIKTDGNGNVTSTFNIPVDSNRKIKNIVDILGRETKGKKNEPLLYIYDDGTVEKRIVIE